ncbi:SRPBCC family protein [Tenacibaculum aiptasiae]|uniref:SRPBCC family protein n=1 Tax=Tenacibaculum aiptasiae TaxID=426481 RepID=UPI00232F0808|nr:SRPBCC domain-containing protein [Tenacibaculum aiptasiae]
MSNIHHHFPINAPISEVFNIISTPKGLNIWWSKTANGNPQVGETYQLSFGPQYNWAAEVSRFTLNEEFELTIIDADSDWKGTKVGFILNFKDSATNVQFYHSGWKESNEHYRISCYCWAMYLRILKRYLEFGEEVPYEDRLNA